MFLESLDVSVNGNVIRSLVFHKGLNFIVDSSVRKKTESGNSVGKTTALRVVDYCLGSDGSDIYKDPEFKNEKNLEVYNFISANHVLATLSLTSVKGEKIILVRDISDEPSLFKINDEEFSNLKSYNNKLKEIIFRLRRNKPTLRQLMPKFIRSDGYKMSHSLRYLHQSTADSAYETLHLTLMGFNDIDSLNKKQELSLERSKADKRLKALKQGQSIVALRQSLNVIERDIEEKEKEVNDFQVSTSYKEEAFKLEKVQQEVSHLALALNEKQLRKSFIDDALAELDQNRSKSESEDIKKIYEEASRFMPTLHVKYEDTLYFHEKMITRKAVHLNKRLSKISLECEELQERLNNASNTERNLLHFISSTGSLNDLKLMNEQLNRLYESKGNKQQALDQLANAEDELRDIDKKLNEVAYFVESQLEDLQKKLSIFNEDFSYLSRQFYDEEYILSYDIVKSKIKFSISNVDGNVGGGKKKGQVAAFDLAYSNFIAKVGLSSLRFVMHDSILFKYASNFDGQYVISVLKEKIDGVEGFNPLPYVRLELSENSKFFKIR